MTLAPATPAEIPKAMTYSISSTIQKPANEALRRFKRPRVGALLPAASNL
jgi:hypothetical protein